VNQSFGFSVRASSATIAFAYVASPVDPPVATNSVPSLANAGPSAPATRAPFASKLETVLAFSVRSIA
jgi:hypothetical protein